MATAKTTQTIPTFNQMIALFDKANERLTKTEELFRENQKKTDEQMRKTDEQIKQLSKEVAKTTLAVARTTLEVSKTTLAVARTTENVNGVSFAVGNIVECVAQGGLADIIEKKYELNDLDQYDNLKLTEKGRDVAEIDCLLIKNIGKLSNVFICECKSRLSAKDVSDLLGKAHAIKSVLPYYVNINQKVNIRFIFCYVKIDTQAKVKISKYKEQKNILCVKLGSNNSLRIDTWSTPNPTPKKKTSESRFTGF